MIKAEIRSNINFPKIALQADLEHIAEKIIIKDMVNRIKQRKAIDGGALPENSAATIKRKGHDRQLQDMGVLINSFGYEKEGRDKVRIFISKGLDRDLIGGYLQNSGVGKSKKRYKFFGISIFAYRKAKEYMEEKIKALTSGR